MEVGGKWSRDEAQAREPGRASQDLRAHDLFLPGLEPWPRPCAKRLSASVAMIHFAVTLKNGEWTAFKDGKPMSSGLSRSAAIELAEGLAFDAEEQGHSVELLIQDYTGALGRKVSGAD